MLKLLSGLKEYLKRPEITSDSLVFRLHCYFTAAILFSFSLIITATQYVGSPIQCIVNKPLPTKPINTYCWIMSTFSMPDAFQRQVGVEVAHPGLGNDFGDEDAKKYYTYYQWVCFALFFQGLFCYTPKWIWEQWERGLLKNLMMGLRVGVYKEEEKDKKKKAIMGYLLEHIRVGSQENYVIKYFICEFLCFINIIMQMYFMNRFFDGEFLTYGLRVLEFSGKVQEDRVDPMVYIFPRVTKCIFHKYGASGSIQPHDSLCVLPLNIVNEKTYIVIWFWFMTLLVLLTSLVIYRAILIFYPKSRTYVMRAKNRLVPIEVANALTKKTGLGDWWILYMLGRNMDQLIYKEIATELAKKIEPAYKS